MDAHNIDKCLRCKKSKTYGLAGNCIKYVLPGTAWYPHYFVGWIPGHFLRGEHGKKLAGDCGGFGVHGER